MNETFRHTLKNTLPSLVDILAVFKLEKVYSFLVIRPLERLYRNGPALHGIGFWRGASSADICAALTPGVPANFWDEHKQECEQMIRNDCMAYIVFVETLLYFYVLFVSVRFVLFLLGSICRHTLKKKGLLERYSPLPLHWLSFLDHSAFSSRASATTPTPRTHRYNTRQRERINQLRAEENRDSPYNAYSNEN